MSIPTKPTVPGTVFIHIDYLCELYSKLSLNEEIFDKFRSHLTLNPDIKFVLLVNTTETLEEMNNDPISLLDTYIYNSKNYRRYRKTAMDHLITDLSIDRFHEDGILYCEPNNDCQDNGDIDTRYEKTIRVEYVIVSDGFNQIIEWLDTNSEYSRNYCTIIPTNTITYNKLNMESLHVVELYFNHDFDCNMELIKLYTADKHILELISDNLEFIANFNYSYSYQHSPRCIFPFINFTNSMTKCRCGNGTESYCDYIKCIAELRKYRKK